MTALLGRHLFRLPSVLAIAARPAILRQPALVLKPGPVLLDVSVRNYAARKGTRERKAKENKKRKLAKKEKEAVSPQAKMKMMRKMRLGQQKSLFPDESEKDVAQDNVFISGHYKWPVFDVETAVQNFKEAHHPTLFDIPNAIVKAYFELDLSTKKKTQFLEQVSGVVELPHKFDTGMPTKSVCLFCKDPTMIAEALKVGADVAVGVEGVKQFQDGALNGEDYDVILAHVDFLPELSPIRGLISKKFPNIKKGTVALDVVQLVKRFKYGVDYEMIQSATDPKLGFLQVPIGTVDMNVKAIAENFAAVTTAVLTHKPNVPNKFITIGAVTCEKSRERFKVNMDSVLAITETQTSEKEENDFNLKEEAARV